MMTISETKNNQQKKKVSNSTQDSTSEMLRRNSNLNNQAAAVAGPAVDAPPGGGNNAQPVMNVPPAAGDMDYAAWIEPKHDPIATDTNLAEIDFEDFRNEDLAYAFSCGVRAPLYTCMI